MGLVSDASSPADSDVVVVGAGIAGLTAAALLARAGLRVQLLEAHHQSGGCAGTFRRARLVFDVGATQVAGLEPGGIHQRLFHHLGVTPPLARPLDPGCVVDLGDGRPAVHLWRDPGRWRRERCRQFPGSERFWRLCDGLQEISWAFAARDPVLPPRSAWDLAQLLRALRLPTLASGLLTTASMADLLRLTGCHRDVRLRRFLDLQLRLYSQEPAARTAALYGATVLRMAQAPLGLWHLEGSMQQLSSRLEQGLRRHGGRLSLRQRVTHLQPACHGGERHWRICAQAPGGARTTLRSRDVVVSLPPQTLPDLIGEHLPAGFRRRLEGLHVPSGALVFYGACRRERLPEACAPHLQLDWPDPGPLFVSVSRDGDGRAPAGQATVIASVFTPVAAWHDLDRPVHDQRKASALAGITRGLKQLLGVPPAEWLHAELATPRAFAHWTGRPLGIVGGQGQAPRRFGLCALASRTPMPGLWLCGDAIHPGEGTAGVSLCALTAVRQLLQERGLPDPVACGLEAPT
jgi:C-3',4' desaturase CrtD